jgi:hypothetical protein
MKDEKRGGYRPFAFLTQVTKMARSSSASFRSSARRGVGHDARVHEEIQPVGSFIQLLASDLHLADELSDGSSPRSFSVMGPDRWSAAKGLLA